MALTSNGKDFIAAQIAGATSTTLAGGASATAVAKWMGITVSTADTLASSTAVTGEETLAGLTRAAGTVTFVAGASSYTLANTFTYTGSGSKVIARVGVFNAVSAGVLVFYTALSTTATLSASGDTLTITQTVTLS
jgi:hypothetical protein